MQHSLSLTDSPPTEDVRVKRETQQQHRGLESILPIAREDFSRADYQFVLERFLGIYQPLEARITEVIGLPASLQWERRRKTSWLEQDLADLGLDGRMIRALPAALAPAMHGVPEALGTMYVLEGATLGGQFIARAVGQRFGLDQHRGCRFFLSYGAEVGSMWRSFGGVVREQLCRPGDQDTFIASAITTFSSFEQWLRKEV